MIFVRLRLFNYLFSINSHFKVSSPLISSFARTLESVCAKIINATTKLP